jgi:hypothetical protein
VNDDGEQNTDAWVPRGNQRAFVAVDEGRLVLKNPDQHQRAYRH